MCPSASTATPTGFEFFKDAKGAVSYVMVRGGEGDRKAVRKTAASGQRP